MDARALSVALIASDLAGSGSVFNSHSSRRRLRAAVPSTSTPASSAADSAGLHPPQAKAPSRAASAAPCPVGSTPSPLRWTDMCPPDPHHLLQSSNPYQPGASPQVNDSKIFTSLERAPPSAPAHPFSLLTSHFPLLTSHFSLPTSHFLPVAIAGLDQPPEHWLARSSQPGAFECSALLVVQTL